MEKLLPIIGILLFMALYGVYQAWVYRDKEDKGPEMTAPATVKRHRVDQGRYLGKAPSRWNHLITFALSDGEEVELYVTDDIFATLKAGQSGQLTWQGKLFYHFDPDA
jgi:hypothetical protein